MSENLAEEMKNSMGFTPNRKRQFHTTKGIPPFMVSHWKSLPDFTITYNTQIQQGSEDTIFTVPVTISKNSGQEVADMSFQGHKFGEIHVGPYKAGDEQRHGPNFVPNIDAETRKKVFGGHITPWTGIFPANIFTKNAFKEIMALKFDGAGIFEITDKSIVRINTREERTQEHEVEVAE